MDSKEGTAILPYREQAVELGTIRATHPAALVKQATEAADALAGVIKDRKLFSTILGRQFVRCEGWTTLAAMMGVLPREASVVKQDDGGYQATVELVRMSDGMVLTRASAECGMDEKTWAERDAYARRSMAITRATSKACRIAFSWIMVLSGYEVTPAEEIPDEPSVPTLPGAPDKWDGYGGKPLPEVPSKTLSAARAWLEKRDAKKNATLIAAIDEELEQRRTTDTRDAA